MNLSHATTPRERRISTTLSVVIPALNEEDAIAGIIQRVLAVEAALPAAGVDDLELIVVDDGSHDATAEIAARNPAVRLVRHPSNRGYGAAIKTGFCHAQGELLAFLDADGTYPPEDLPNLCRAALQEGADLVIGSRMSGKDSQMPRLRWIGNNLWIMLLSLVGNSRVSDPASGMRVIRREALPHLYPLPDGLNFTPAMSTRAIHENLKMVEVPICYRERVGRSKLNVVKDGFRFVHSILWTAFTYNPVRLLGALGVGALLLAGLVAASLAVFPATGWEQGIPAYRLGMTLVLAVTGVSLFTVGTLFNYLVSLFHRRPVRQGLFGRPVLKTPLERHFGWLGLATVIAGAGVNLAAIYQGLRGPFSSAYPLLLLGSGMLLLTGLQLILSWLLVLALSELSEREVRVREEMGGRGAEEQGSLGAEEQGSLGAEEQG